MEKANANPKNVTKKKFNFQSFLGGKKKKEKKRNDTKIGSRGGYSFAISNSLLYAPMSIYLYVCVCAHKHPARKCVSSFLPVSIFVCCIPSSPPPLIPLSPFLTNTRRQKKGGKKITLQLMQWRLLRLCTVQYRVGNWHITRTTTEPYITVRMGLFNR